MRSASLATSESVASAIASVGALRWRAIFIARTTSGCGRPARQADHERALVDAPEPRQRLLRRRGGDLGADVEQHQQVAQVGGEERHLVGAGDQHACRRRRSPRSRPRPPSGDDLARGVLDVDVVGGDRLLERVHGRARTAAPRRLEPARRRRAAVRGGTPRARPPAAPGSPRSRAPALKRTTVDDDVFARRASSSAVWKATSSRWSTTYCATSFCERENSSKREEM